MRFLVVPSPACPPTFALRLFHSLSPDLVCQLKIIISSKLLLLNHAIPFKPQNEDNLMKSATAALVHINPRQRATQETTKGKKSENVVTMDTTLK